MEMPQPKALDILPSIFIIFVANYLKVTAAKRVNVVLGDA
jgi:hypothetical protein